MTDEEKKQLVDAVITQLKNEGTDVSNANIVTNANGIDYVVAYGKNGEIVRAVPTAISGEKTGASGNMNSYTEAGVYNINTTGGEDLPIDNQGVISARLTVLVTESDGNKVITQVLNLNNNAGGEGNVYIRSCQNGEWKAWGKLQTNVEVGQVNTLDHLTDNGIYSGVLTDGTPTSAGTFYDTFVLIVINNYAVSIPTGNPQSISQLKYSLGLDGSISVASRKRDQYGYWDNWVSLDEKSLVEEEKTRAEQAEQAIKDKAVEADSLKFLTRANVVALDYQTIEGVGDEITIPAATSSNAGVMSVEDKEKLDSLEIINDAKKDTFYIIDKDGKVIVKIDKDGLSTTSVKAVDEGELKDILQLLSHKQPKEEGKGLSTNDFTNEIKKGVEPLIGHIKHSYNDGVFVTDKFGNVIFKLDADGIASTGASIGNTHISQSYKGIVIADKSGNVVFRISTDGKIDFVGKAEEIDIDQYLKISDYQKWLAANTLYGKNVYSLCDSLGEGSNGVFWQKVLAERCGAKFHYGNGRELVSGGTQTCGGGGYNSGFVRAMNLYNNYGPDKVDVILIENINDMNANMNGSIGDMPFVPSQLIECENIYTSTSEVTEALPSIIANITPKVGTILDVLYTNANSYTIKISGSPRNSGSLSFSINNDKYRVTTNTITANATITQIVEAVASAEWTQYGYSVIASGSDSVIVSGSNAFSLKAINSLEGVTSLITGSVGASRVSYMFHSFDVSEWNDITKWKKPSEMSLYSTYKGFLEYLQTHFPKAQIYFCILPRLIWNSKTTTYKRKDGSFDWDKYTPKTEKLYEIQEEVCNYMMVECINLAHRCGINIYNMHEYFPENNVHPTGAGYKYIGEQLARMIF